MSRSDAALSLAAAAGKTGNNPYEPINWLAEEIWELSEAAVTREEADLVTDAAVTALMTAAVRLYAKKCDGEARTFRPLKGDYDEVVTPTEALTACTELLRALHLGPMEFALWARRQPETYYDEPFAPAREDKAP
ncbi:hypothetical protein [Pseudoruegeria sp. HB172150]|uniref:hypothetical protein n=1 Tax=Pseudoruegeria sp. HB172150 TaxID=2721164 RepID=UPI00155769CB|nr:hypothetical protein [Pseudoruegeria sp. HB172150]